MKHVKPFGLKSVLLHTVLVALALTVPELVFAQASPFMTGATAIQTNILAWLTPIAIILVMVLGAMAMAKKLGPGSTIVTILCDYGNRYLSKLYNGNFLKEKGLPTPSWYEG